MSKSCSYMILFEFEMPATMEDKITEELGQEVAANVRSFFKAKRHDQPMCGSLTIIRNEPDDICEQPGGQR